MAGGVKQAGLSADDADDKDEERRAMTDRRSTIRQRKPAGTEGATCPNAFGLDLVHMPRPRLRLPCYPNWLPKHTILRSVLRGCGRFKAIDGDGRRWSRMAASEASGAVDPGL